MKLIIFAASLAITGAALSGTWTEVPPGAFFEIYKRCDYCEHPLAQVGIRAQWNTGDFYGYGLVAQNTNNVHRWHHPAALTSLWAMDYGLYYCEGRFRLQDGKRQLDLFIDGVLTCRPATQTELHEYQTRYQESPYWNSEW